MATTTATGARARGPRRHRSGGGALLALLTCFSVPASATEFAVAQRSDDEIRQFVHQVLPAVERLEEEQRRGSVILADVVLLNCGRYHFERTENRTFHVFDDSDPTIATQTVRVRESEVRLARGWRVDEDGRVARLDDDQVRVRRDADTGIATISLSFSDLRPGDTFGWSIATRHDQGLAMRREPMRFSRPVLQGRLYVLTEATLTYRLDLRNVDTEDVVFDRSEAPGRQQIDYADQPPRHDEVLMLPWVSREPHVTVTRASRSFDGLWIQRDDWDQWMADDWGDPRRWYGVTDRVRWVAEGTAAGQASDQARADALYRFVRDEIGEDPRGDLRRELGLSRPVRRPGPWDLWQAITTPEEPRPMRERLARKDVDGTLDFEPIPGRYLPGRLSRPARDPQEVLRAGNGTAFERTVLLASLLAAIDLPARIGLVRDRSLGLPDLYAPGPWHFSDLVVLLLTADGRPDRWYCLTRGLLPPGVLPPSLVGASALFAADDMSARLDAVWERESFISRGREIVFAREYDLAIRDQPLALRVRVDAVADTIGAQMDEHIRRGGDPAEAPASIRWRGEPSKLWPGSVGDPIDPVLYWQRRWPSAHVLEVGTATERIGGDSLVVESEARLELPALAQPDESRWALDGPTLFGQGTLSGWSGPQRSAFHVPGPQLYRWTVELPLPDGWDAVYPPTSLELDTSILTYRARAWTESGSVVAERVLRLRPGTVRAESLRELDRTIRTILEHESRPMVLVRLPAQR